MFYCFKRILVFPVDVGLAVVICFKGIPTQLCVHNFLRLLGSVVVEVMLGKGLAEC